MPAPTQMPHEMSISRRIYAKVAGKRTPSRSRCSCSCCRTRAISAWEERPCRPWSPSASSSASTRRSESRDLLVQLQDLVFSLLISGFPGAKLCDLHVCLSSNKPSECHIAGLSPLLLPWQVQKVSGFNDVRDLLNDMRVFCVLLVLCIYLLVLQAWKKSRRSEPVGLPACKTNHSVSCKPEAPETPEDAGSGDASLRAHRLEPLQLRLEFVCTLVRLPSLFLGSLGSLGSAC